MKHKNINKNLGFSLLTLVLLLSTVFFSCKKSKQKKEPPIYYNGQYVISQINLFGQPLPTEIQEGGLWDTALFVGNTATNALSILDKILNQFLMNTVVEPLIDPLADDQKMAGVFIMSELAKGLRKYMDLYPNDIDANSTISTNTDAFLGGPIMTTYDVYDAIFAKPTNEGLLEDFILIISAPAGALLPPNVDFLSLFTNPEKVKLVYGNYQDFTTEQTLTGLFVIDKRSNRNYYIDPAFFNDTFIPMLVRMLANHGVVKQLARISKSWILPEGIEPKPEALFGILSGIPQAFLPVLSADLIKKMKDILDKLDMDYKVKVNEILASIPVLVYNQINLKFENDQQIRVLASGSSVGLSSEDIILPMRVHSDPQYFSVDLLLSSWLEDGKLPNLPLTLKTAYNNSEGMRLVVPKESIMDIIKILMTIEMNHKTLDSKDLNTEKINGLLVLAQITGIISQLSYYLAIDAKQNREWLALFILMDQLFTTKQKSNSTAINKALNDLLPQELISVDLYKFDY